MTAHFGKMTRPLNMADLPFDLRKFIQENEIDPREYFCKDTLPRYIRLNPRSKDPPKLEELRKTYGASVEPVEWFPSFFRMDSSCRVASSDIYKQGRIYGMDIASAVAVYALSIDPNDHVLDLCCAPGGKLAYISDHFLADSSSMGTVTGVDIAQHRLAVCKKICQKYKLHTARLFQADGTLFNVHAPSRIGHHQRPVSKPIKERVHVKPFHAAKLIRSDPEWESESLLYDKVLVDAECTHDGSISHLFFNDDQVSWKSFDQIFNSEKLQGIEALQRGLISNGFKMLKPCGVLVYSTCSFSKRQNEDIIAWFLSENSKNARLESVPGYEGLPSSPAVSPSPPFEEYRDIIMANVLRFSPSMSRTSGLFIARIRKLSLEES